MNITILVIFCIILLDTGKRQSSTIHGVELNLQKYCFGIKPHVLVVDTLPGKNDISLEKIYFLLFFRAYK